MDPVVLVAATGEARRRRTVIWFASFSGQAPPERREPFSREAVARSRQRKSNKTMNCRVPAIEGSGKAPTSGQTFSAQISLRTG